MHTLTIPEGIAEPIPVTGGRPLGAGQSYVCTNAFTGSLLMTPWRVVIDGEMWALRKLLRADYFNEPEFDPSQNWNGRHIWLMRAAGWGDLLMLTPLIRELKRRWPASIIHVARGDAYAGVFQGLDVIEETIPIELNALPPFAFGFVSFEEWIEGHPAAERIHMAQHFADKLKIDLGGDHQPDYIISEDEEMWRSGHFLKTVKKRIGIQYMASALYRSYPFIEKVIKLLLEYDVEVFLFGAKGQLAMKGDLPPGLTNLTDPSLECDFRKSAAVAKSCDCIIAPDSAMVHLASALEIPYVGLYGPIPPQLRGSGKYGKGIQGVAPCSPCFFHANLSDDFPAGMPCQEAGYCVALAQITPEQIVDEALRLASPIIQLPKQGGRSIILP